MEDLVQKINEQTQDISRLKESVKNYQKLMVEKDQTIEEKVKLYHQQQTQSASYKNQLEQHQKQIVVGEESIRELNEEVNKLNGKIA